MTQKATRAQTDRTHTMPQCFLLPRRHSRLPPSTPYTPSPPSPSPLLLRMEPVWPKMIPILIVCGFLIDENMLRNIFCILMTHVTCHIFLCRKWVSDKVSLIFPLPYPDFPRRQSKCNIWQKAFSITFSFWWLWTKSNTNFDDDDESASCFPFPRVRRAVWNLKRMQFFDWWILNEKSANFIREKCHPKGL